jgi:enoyl-[acyl-carrier protein] reductase I
MNLSGKKGLVVGIANEHSIAFHCAQLFRALDAELAVTFRNKKDEPEVRRLAERLGASVVAPMDVRDDVQIATVFRKLQVQWSTIDFLLHAVAFAPRADLEGRFTDTSREGFLSAMETSCYSLLKLTQQAEPLMANGGCVLTLSHYGAHKYVSITTSWAR